MEFNQYFGSLLIGEVGGEFTDIISGENAAVVFLNGRMEGIGGKYENDYAIRYTVNSEGKVSNIKEWLSDIHLATQLYGEEISVAEIARLINLPIFYCKTLSLIHNEHQSTKESSWKENYKHSKNTYYYLKKKYRS